MFYFSSCTLLIACLACAICVYSHSMEGHSKSEHVSRSMKDLGDTLHWLNDQHRKNIEQDIFQEVVHNVMATMRYEYLEQHGPRREKITVDHTIVPRSAACVCMSVCLSVCLSAHLSICMHVYLVVRTVESFFCCCNNTLIDDQEVIAKLRKHKSLGYLFVRGLYFGSR